MKIKTLSGSYKIEEKRLLAMAKCHLGFVDNKIKKSIQNYLQKEGWKR